MARFANLSVGLSVDSTSYRRGLNQAQSTTRTFGQRLSATLQGTAGGFFSLQRVATASVAAIGAAVVGYTTAALRANDEIAKQARNIGFSTQAFQMYSLGLQQADISQGGFVKIVQQITRSLGDAEAGLETNIRAYEQLGLSFEELAQLSPEAQFREVVTALQNVESPTTRASAGAVILGREWRNVGTLIEQGIESVLASTDNITVASQEAIDAAEEINDGWLRISQTFQNQIGNITLPILANFVDLLGDVTNSRPYEPIRELIDELSGGISSADELTDVTGNLFNQIVPLIAGVESLDDRQKLYRETLEGLRGAIDVNSFANQALRYEISELIRETDLAITAAEAKAVADAKAAAAEKTLQETREMLIKTSRSLIDAADPYAAAVRQGQMDTISLVRAEKMGLISKEQLNLAVDGLNQRVKELSPVYRQMIKDEEDAEKATMDLEAATRGLVSRYAPFIAATRDANADLATLSKAMEEGVELGASFATIFNGITEALDAQNPVIIQYNKDVASLTGSLDSLVRSNSTLTSEQLALQDADALRLEATRLGITLTDEQIEAYERLSVSAELSAERQILAQRRAIAEQQVSTLSLTQLQQTQLSTATTIADGIANVANAVANGSREAFLISKAAAVAQVYVDYAQGQVAAAVAGARANAIVPGSGFALTAAILTQLNIATGLSLATIAAQTLTGLQTGGRVTQPGVFTVGENGPENIYLPGNAEVAANGSALGPGSGRGSVGDVTIVNQIGPNISPRQIGDSTGRRFIDFVNNGVIDSGSVSIGRQRTAI